MIIKKMLRKDFKKAVLGVFFVIMGLFAGLFTPVLNVETVYADETNETTEVKIDENEGENEQTAQSQNGLSTNVGGGDGCQDSLGAIGWLVCPTTGKIAEAVDWLYEKLESILVISPVSAEDGSPIYEIWKYCLSVTNIVFVIFLLIVIYSQITGYGITNYGIKKSLPKLIVAAVLVNLSFLICSIAVDVSNILGNGIRGIFTAVQESVVNNGFTAGMKVSYAGMFGSLTGGTALAVGAGVIAFETGAIWMLIPTVLGAIVAVAVGLITIALRQAVVALLIMIAPLAIVAYILPNTEQWFKKWKQLLTKMLVFYPMFSLLFGASSLAGFAIIASAKDGFGILLGTAVQIFPLFFSWKLMQMSGTFLSTINGKIQGLAAKPLATNKAWADSHRAQTSAYYAQYGRTPFSHMRRYLDNKKNLRETNTENLRGLRKNEASIYVQRRIANGYDGTKAQGTSGDLKSNKYTRTAKDFSNSKLAAETAKMDTEHVLNEYGNYFVDPNTRKRIDSLNKVIKGNDAKAAKDAAEELKTLRMRDADAMRAATGANNYLEYTRAKMTAENDSEADFNFMVDEYLAAVLKNRPDIKSEGFDKYKHYIMSSAGGLGSVGQVRVLGKIIAQAAAVESSQRRDINIVAAKFPPDKTNFRNMVVGYHVNDNGVAVNKAGDEIEEFRGQLLKENPDKLTLWDKVDAEGRPYYDWYDTNGNYVTRIYKKDKSAVKEILSNFDATINDPINNLYGILAGIKEGDIKGKDEKLKNIGLDGFRTTVGRAVLGAPFKEKNAAFSPMVAEMINKGYIKNYATEYLAYLDSLNKATKPGSFNTQDSDAIKMFATIMNPENWDKIFAKELVKDFKNVNGKPLTGLRDVIDPETGAMKTIDVPIEEATQEEIMRKIKKKFLFPAAKKMTTMMSRQTSSTADNQKAGTIEEWKKLKDVLDNYPDKVGMDPYEQVGDMRRIAYDIKQKMHVSDEEKFNYYDDVRFMYEHQTDNDSWALLTQYLEYCDKHREKLSNVKGALMEWANGKSNKRIDFSTNELVEMMEDLLNQFANPD